MEFSFGLIYAGVAAAFWGGMLTLGFRALRTYREQRQLDRAKDSDLDDRLSRLESDIGAIRRAIEHGAAPGALAPGTPAPDAPPPAARSGERLVAVRPSERSA